MLRKIANTCSISTTYSICFILFYTCRRLWPESGSPFYIDQLVEWRHFKRGQWQPNRDSDKECC